MNDHELILAIQELMSGEEWNSETMSAIADLLQNNGYEIEDID